MAQIGNRSVFLRQNSRYSSLEALHSTMKVFSKLGRANISGEIPTDLSFWNALVTVWFHLKEFFFNKAVSGVAMRPYLFINFL